MKAQKLEERARQQPQTQSQESAYTQLLEKAQEMECQAQHWWEARPLTQHKQGATNGLATMLPTGMPSVSYYANAINPQYQ